MLLNRNFKLKINRNSDVRVCYAFIILLLCSLVALTINQLIYQYPGNYYLPTNTSLIASALLLIYAGFYLQWGYHDKRTQGIKEIIYFFLVMGLIGMATNAVQYTPFVPIDNKILQIETALTINSQSIMTWAHTKHALNTCLEWIYNTLPYQMAYIPLFIIITGRRHRMREFYFLLLTSTTIGFSIYYFFPTTAPASMINSPYFTQSQHATALKFMQIHRHISPSTLDGGLIAFPSFHVIWAWYCCYLLRDWRLIFGFSLLFNIILSVACVLLGWHYCLDILGSILVITVSHYLYQMNPSHDREEVETLFPSNSKLNLR